MLHPKLHAGENRCTFIQDYRLQEAFQTQFLKPQFKASKSSSVCFNTAIWNRPSLKNLLQSKNQCFKFSGFLTIELQTIDSDESSSPVRQS